MYIQLFYVTPHTFFTEPCKAEALKKHVSLRLIQKVFSAGAFQCTTFQPP